MDTSTRDSPTIHTATLTTYSVRPPITGHCVSTRKAVVSSVARSSVMAPTALVPALSSNCAAALSSTPVRMKAKVESVMTRAWVPECLPGPGLRTAKSC
ncbi:hypothetical protein D3C81_949530 [compost metagenome]